MRREQLQHRLSAFKEMRASRVVHVRLPAVEGVEPVPLFRGGGVEKGLEEAVPDEAKGRAEDAGGEEEEGEEGQREGEEEGG